MPTPTARRRMLSTLRTTALGVLVAVALGGCGDHTEPSLPNPVTLSESPITMSDQAHKCRVSVSSMANEFEATLKEARAAGLHSSLPELAVRLNKLIHYVESRRERPDCRGLLRALVSSAKEPAQK
jgi:hypothetical protein